MKNGKDFDFTGVIAFVIAGLGIGFFCVFWHMIILFIIKFW